jgi:D-aminopeptidase
LSEKSREECGACTFDDDCKGELVCQCVDEEETGELHCSACVPESYAVPSGSNAGETYTCEEVEEKD